MKKNPPDVWVRPDCIEKYVRKSFRVMKLTLFLLLFFLATANAYTQKVTISVKSTMTLNEVLRQIKDQADIRILYDAGKTKQVYCREMDISQLEINEALKQVLQNTRFEFFEEGGAYIVRERIAPQANVLRIVGTVTDEKKQPLPGVTVQIKGTSVGTATNREGKYQLSVPNAPDKFSLIFSYIGMITQEVAYTGKETIDVVLKEDMETLDDVVVTGFNNIRNTSFTGNAITIKQEDLLKVSKTNVIKALQSFDPSFRIKENNQWGADPNVVPEVYIRGESGVGIKQLDKEELTKSNLVDNPNLPTFIMDGFEISVTKLYDMDPNRIESITILKDATATALYGSRAANGVVVITTVPPKAGKLNVSYNLVGDVTFPDLSGYNLLNAEEKLETEQLAGCFVYDPTDKYADEYALKKEYNEKLAHVLKGVDTYWLSKPLRTVLNHKHSVYVDGGGENLRFGIELLYTNQDGVMKGSLRDRVGAGFSLQYSYNSLIIKNQVTYQRVNVKESPYGNFADYAKQLPYDVYKDENGNYLETLKSWGTGSPAHKVNPLYEPSLHNFDKRDTDELINNLSLNWNILNGLLLKGQLSLTKYISESRRFYDPLSKQSGNVNKLSVTELSSGTLYLGHSDGLTFDLSATLSYNRALENHMVNALIGVTMKEDKTTQDNAVYIGFPSGALSSPQHAKEMYNKTIFSESTKRLAGFLLSLNYSYRDIYLLDASVRIDGSSAFGADKRFAPFWSVGLGVNLHKYKFMESVDFVNQLKIRGSYGQTGKANFPAYAAQTTYQMSSDRWYKTGFSAKLKALGNRNLIWETTNTFDIGAEVGLLDHRLYVKGSYYNKRTIDLINDVTVPTSTGFTSYRDNIGEVSNKGYEFDVRVVALNNNDLSLIVNANLAHNKNRIEKISASLKAYNERVRELFETPYAYNDPEKALQSQPFLQYEEGGSLSSIWGVKSLGINPADGQEVFVNRQGDLTKTWAASDQVVLGTSEPTVQGTFGISLSYKQFTFYTNFMYELGGQRYNQTLVDKVENVNVYTDNVDKRVLSGRWKQPGDIAKYKSLVTGRTVVDATKPTSRFVQDYNMLSWNSLELGYSAPSAITQKLHLSMLRFSVGMNDILHLSSVKQERGISYPFARTVNFSLNVSF